MSRYSYIKNRQFASNARAKDPLNKELFQEGNYVKEQDVVVIKDDAGNIELLMVNGKNLKRPGGFPVSPSNLVLGLMVQGSSGKHKLFKKTSEYFDLVQDCVKTAKEHLGPDAEPKYDVYKAAAKDLNNLVLVVYQV